VVFSATCFVVTCSPSGFPVVLSPSTRATGFFEIKHVGLDTVKCCSDVRRCVKESGA
jgi:hypothetical protein